jgi:hypothetical protein
MSLPIPQIGSGGQVLTNSESFETIIPDAYKVSITLTSLVAETRNFLYSMLYEKKNLVSASTRSGDIGSILNTIGTSNNGLLASSNLNPTNALNEILPNLGVSNLPT